ncbi:Transcriptional regulator, GntR family [hydrothermal vent metagenome]|uniref:Transcriptional regulator, GntR family n=1 Tax=hydrothermal vent metagenome TaxID=652676 RepID=A0A3B1E0Y9_9ZZZZ
MIVISLRKKAYTHIRKKLILGQLPAGTQLSEPEIAKELGMSRTPVREALHQMEMEGLVKCYPRLGTVVHLPNKEELVEMFGVREALESHAIVEAVQQINKEQLDKMECLHNEMCEIAITFKKSDTEYMQGDLLDRHLMADMAFHRVMFLASGNCYLTKLLEDTSLLSRIFRTEIWVYDRPTIDIVNGFHARILETLKQRDIEAARRVTIEAMQAAKFNSLKKFEEQQKLNENNPYEI